MADPNIQSAQDLQALALANQMTANQPPPNLVPPEQSTVAAPTTPGNQRQGLRPIALDLIDSLRQTHNQAPADNWQLSQRQSRAQGFEKFLGNFIYALGQGMEHQGSGPGSFSRGFGAAVQAPYQLGLQQQAFQNQMAQQQAATEATQQEAALRQRQAQMAATGQMMQLPDGRMVWVPVGQIGQVSRGIGTAEAARAGAQARMNVAQLQVAVAAGTAAKYLPDVDPTTGAPFYRVMNKFGRQIGTADASVIPQLMQRTSNTVQWVQQADGSYAALPKTTVTGPIIPGARGAPGSAVGAPVKPIPGGKAGGASRIPKAQSGPVPGVTGIRGPNATKWAMWNNPQSGAMEAGPISEAPKGASPVEIGSQAGRDIINARHGVQLLTKIGPANDPSKQGVIQLIESLQKDGKLGILASRWNAFATRHIGASPGDDPRIVTLIDKNMLGDTLLMLSHFGAAGGRSPQMLEHFVNLMNAGKMDGPTLLAGVKASADYMRDRAMIPTVRFQSRGIMYSIPADKVSAFKKDNPAAIQVK